MWPSTRPIRPAKSRSTGRRRRSRDSRPDTGVALAAAACLVTGASRGIGKALAEALAAEPVGSVLVGVRDLGRYERIEPPSGGAAAVTPGRMDLSSAEAIESSGA